MENIKCLECIKWKEKKAETLECCASIFDAASEMEKFEEDCRKTCPLLNNS